MGLAGDNHGANGHTLLPLQLGQLARPVKITSQSTQNKARSSTIGPWNKLSSDTIGTSMACPPLRSSREAGIGDTPCAGPTSQVLCTVLEFNGKSDARGRSRADGPGDLADRRGAYIAWALAHSVVSPGRGVSPADARKGFSAEPRQFFLTEETDVSFTQKSRVSCPHVRNFTLRRRWPVSDVSLFVSLSCTIAVSPHSMRPILVSRCPWAL
jgi:hypothetical protein